MTITVSLSARHDISITITNISMYSELLFIRAQVKKKTKKKNIRIISFKDIDKIIKAGRERRG